jgi:hypothetical protein
MKLLEKIKLLFKVKEPAGELIDTLKTAKTGWKTWGFWATLAGTLASTAAALSGVIPAQAQLVLTTGLQAIYNILRGASKADDPAVKGIFRTTEFWLSTLTEVQKGLVAVETGGINPEWMATATAIVGMALAAGQNLAARTPAK